MLQVIGFFCAWYTGKKRIGAFWFYLFHRLRSGETDLGQES